MRERAEKIYQSDILKSKKIKLLEEFVLDCCNEMEAQEENMHPEIQHNLAEGLRVAKDYLRDLGEN